MRKQVPLPPRSRSPARENQERVTKVIDIATDDAAFVLGRGGATKRKIATPREPTSSLTNTPLTITLNGTEKQCNHAIDYIDFIKQQRVGPVTIDMERCRGDFTGHGPGDCIGFVMGEERPNAQIHGGGVGRAHVFAKTEGSQRGDDEQLCIFGPLSCWRGGAELKTMSAVEHKHPGYCVSSKGELRDVDRVPGDEDEGGGASTPCR